MPRMMDLKLLFFSVIFLCTSQFVMGKSALKPHQRKDVVLRTDEEELLFNDRVLMEAKKPKVGHFSTDTWTTAVLCAKLLQTVSIPFSKDSFGT